MQNQYRFFGLILTIFFCLSSYLALAQTNEVSGIITDDTDNSPIPGVNVVIKGTSQGTVTDIKGEFSLTGLSADNILIFSYVGYLTTEVTVGDQSFFSVQLTPDITSLQEVVVIGYGEEKKSLVTGAIGSVKSETIETVSNSSVEQTIQGRVAGVNVIPTSGSPGSPMKIRIRGTGSNGNNDPLYIVDGMRVSNIDNIDPNEIEGMEILKDAAASAIYGAEGGNGVVYITTKTGKSGKVQVNYNFQYGVQSMTNNMPMINAEQYSIYLDEANATGPQVPDPDDFRGVEGTNWFNAITENAPFQRHSISFSGGGPKSSLMLGINYYTEEGVVGADKASFDRWTARFNSSHKIKKWLEVGNNLSYSRNTRAVLAEDDEFRGNIASVIFMDPITPIRYNQGAEPAFVQDLINIGAPVVRDANGNVYGLSEYVYGEIVNPLALRDIVHGETITDRIMGTFFANITPFKNFKFTSRFGLDGSFKTFHGWNQTYYLNPENLNNTSTVFDTYTNNFNYLWENFASYDLELTDHYFNILLGTSFYQENERRIGGSSSPMFREEDRFAYHDFTLDEATQRINGRETEFTILSYFGRLSYNYKQKYMVNATFRRDGTSKVPNNKWGTFPSFSAGWVISNENFFSSELFTTLKLRGSWGQNGSLKALGPEGNGLAAITAAGLRYPTGNNQFVTVAELNQIPNPDITWETSEQLDIGLEIGMFNNRLFLEMDYYNKNTEDLLTLGTPPDFLGYAPPFVNGGTVRNRGFEFAANYRNVEGPFTYGIGFNMATLNNEVTKTGENVEKIFGADIGIHWQGATVMEQGQPIWYFHGYKTNGIFQSQEQINQYISDNNLTDYSPVPGDPIVLDVNNDGTISSADQTYIGDPHPDFTYGLNVNLAYKGFDFLIFVQGSYGQDVIMGFNRTDRGTANKPEFFYTNRWTGAGSTNEWPRADVSNNFIYAGSTMVRDASFSKIRQLQFGYSLPEAINQRLKINKLRFYISLDNYFTFTKYEGFEPEAGSQNENSLGIDRGVYPIPRKFLGGLTFNF